MKFLKAFLLSVLLPISGFSATNLFNDVWISGSLRMTFGTPGAGRVLTSDATGVGTWQVPVTAGDVFTNGFASTKLNFYNTSVTNDMARGPLWGTILSLNTNTHIYSTIFGANRYAEGGLLVKPVGGTALGGAGFGVAAIVGLAASPEIINLAVYMEGGRGVSYNARGIDYDTGTGVPFQIRDGSSNIKLRLASSADLIVTNHIGYFQNTLDLRGAQVIVSSNLIAHGNVIMGDTAANTATWNFSTAAIPNSLNIGSSALYISNAWGAGVNVSSLDGNRFRVNTPTTSVPSADSLLSASVSNRVILHIQGQPTQLSNYMSIASSTGVGSIFNVTSSGNVGIGTANPVSKLAVSTNGNGFEFVPAAPGSASTFSTFDRVNTLYSRLNIDASNITFRTHATSPVTRMLIDNQGVTIGTNGTPVIASISATFSIDPPSIPAEASFYTNVTISGVLTTGAVFHNSDVISSNIIITAQCTNNGSVVIGFTNPTVGAIDGGAQNVVVRVAQ